MQTTAGLLNCHLSSVDGTVNHSAFSQGNYVLRTVQHSAAQQVKEVFGIQKAVSFKFCSMEVLKCIVQSSTLGNFVYWI